MAINFQAIEAFLAKDSDDLSEIAQWCERLSEYDLDGSETPKDIEILVHALRHLMTISYTAAEELREVAEKEAVIMAEKEESWEEQRQELKEELTTLRERMTATADAGESSEAFRAEIYSLREENRQMQQSNRDRDREMADQRDRFENLVARTESLTRERDSLIDHRAQLEDTIRELNRRISSKNEETTGEWETKKLKQRNEQAVTLSRQMQVVVSQNDDLRNEVNRLSDTLEEATVLIAESADRYAKCSIELEQAQSTIERLIEESAILKTKLDEKMIFIDEQTTKQLDSGSNYELRLKERVEEIETLRRNLADAMAEIQRLEANIREDTTEEKEMELEKLKQELVAATKLARSLFGDQTTNQSATDPSPILRRQIIQLETSLQEARQQIDNMKKIGMEQEDMIVNKETINSQMAEELDKMKEMKYGDARSEVSNLEIQLRFRDAQIARLTNQCTLLQIELGRYAEGTNTQPRSTQPIAIKEVLTRKQKENSLKDNWKEEIKSPQTPISSEESEESTEKERKIREHHGTHRKERVQTVGEIEQQAMLIAGIYHELVQIMKETELKERQNIEMEYRLTDAQKIIKEMKTQLKVSYQEIVKLKKKEEVLDEKTIKEETQVEIMELKRLAETIRLGGTEIERRSEETTRKLIGERIEKIRLARANTILRTKCSRLEGNEKIAKEKLVNIKMKTSRQMAKIQYELDCTVVALASVQNELIQSIPLTQYDQLMKKYKNCIIKETIGSNIEIIDQPSDSIHILSKNDEKGRNEDELIAQNKYLKKMVDIVSEQCDFWSNEADMLQKESNELKKFIEDIENDSDLKNVLGAIERRLLETIREQQELARDQSIEYKKGRDAEDRLAVLKVEWNAERKHFIQIIRILQRNIMTLKTNSLGSANLEHFEILKRKIEEIKEKEIQIDAEKKKTDDTRSQLEIQLNSSKSLNKARDYLDEESPDRQRAERLLQAAYISVETQTVRADNINKIMMKQKSEMEEVTKELEETQKWNEELIDALSKTQIGRRDKREMIEGDSREEKKSFIKTLSDERETENAETDYEMDMSETSSNSDSSHVANQVKTVVWDNSKYFENRIKQMKDAAEECIKGYKAQLAQKDAAIESYRELLISKINEKGKTTKEVEIIREEVKIIDEQTEERLRQAVNEVARLQAEVEDLEVANRTLFRERKRSFIPTVTHASCQTDNEKMEIDGETETTKEEEKDRNADDKNMPRSSEIMETIGSMRKDETLKYTNEIRNLKNRIRNLTVTNKELLATCENIRIDALEEINAKREREEGIQKDDIIRERVELNRLRKENRNIRKTIEEQKTTIINLTTQLSMQKKDGQEEIIRWEERKRTEENMNSLRKKLKDSTRKEEEIKGRLEKREKRLEEMRRDEELRQKDIEKMNRRMKEIKLERDSALREAEKTLLLSEKIIVLEDMLRGREKDLILLQSKLKKSENELVEATSMINIKKEEAKREISSVPSTRSKGGGYKSGNTRESTEMLTDRTTVTRNSIRDTKETLEKTVVIKEIAQIVDNSNEKSLRKQLRLAELRYTESMEKLNILEEEKRKLIEENEKLMKRIGARDERATGAVAVLGDKLQAKDREINQLKVRITTLERRLSK